MDMLEATAGVGAVHLPPDGADRGGRVPEHPDDARDATWIREASAAEPGQAYRRRILGLRAGSVSGHALEQLRAGLQNHRLHAEAPTASANRS